MSRRAAIGISLLLLTFACAACGSAQQSAPSSGSAAAAQTASSGGSASGCQIDAAKLCDQERDAPVTDPTTGLSLDARAREMTQGRTTGEHFTMTTPGGTPITIECELNSRRSAIIYAHVARGPHLTQADNDWLRQSGYCKQ